METRRACAADAEAMARIYNEGIEDRIATFETRLRTAGDVRGWLDGPYPVVVVDDEETVVAWASSFAYSERACYAGVAEISIYVARQARGKGAGRQALEGLVAAAIARGLHKLTGKVFAENRASRALLTALGFREVGVHLRHGQLDGAWHDIVVFERLLP